MIAVSRCSIGAWLCIALFVDVLQYCSAEEMIRRLYYIQFSILDIFVYSNMFHRDMWGMQTITYIIRWVSQPHPLHQFLLRRSIQEPALLKRSKISYITLGQSMPTTLGEITITYSVGTVCFYGALIYCLIVFAV